MMLLYPCNGATERKKELGQNYRLLSIDCSLHQVVQILLTYLRSDSYEPKGASPSIPNRLFAIYVPRLF